MSRRGHFGIGMLQNEETENIKYTSRNEKVKTWLNLQKLKMVKKKRVQPKKKKLCKNLF